jgi:hypothetical protein
MSVSYHFLASERDYQLVTTWFAALEYETTIKERPDGIWLYFRAMATESLPDSEHINQETTPLVWISKPKKRSDILWTDAEVCFTATLLKSQFPELNKISMQFAKWLKQFDLVFARKENVTREWNYYLEGGIRNFSEKLYALPDAMAALQKGRYFVHHRANDAVLDTVVKALRLRGYDFDTNYPV